MAAADDTLLPAHSQIRTPHTELSDMFLIEPERGCHRGCTYCVMRRSTNGGMRLVAPAKVASLIPSDVRRVGLVGAAVTDHPGLPEILRHIVDGGREVGISSLRADRLNDEIVGLLKRGGYRTLTTAADGASERMRDIIQRKTKERHLLRAAELSRATWDVTVQALHDDWRARRDRRRHRRAGALFARAGQGGPQGRPGDCPLRRQAKDAPRRLGRSSRSTSSTIAWPACAGRCRGA